MFLTIIEIMTIVISVFIALNCVIKHSRSGLLIVYILFFIVCVLPLVLDYIIGLPDYTYYNVNGRYNGFIKTFDDIETRALYCVFLLISQLILTFSLSSFDNRKKEIIHNNRNSNYQLIKTDTKCGFISGKTRIIAVLVALFPVIITFLFGNTNMLYSFGWRDFHTFDYITSQSWYSIAEKITYLGVTASIVLLLMKYDLKLGPSLLYRFIALALLLMNICIESKRSILFFAIIVFFTVLLYGRNVKFKKLVIVFSFISFVAILYSIYIKTTARNYTGFDALYTALRIDIFRDDRIRMAIYSWLHPEEIHILDYPFQSYICQIKYFFCLDIIVGKFKIPFFPAIGYNRFFSSALMGVSLDAGVSYMTTSLFDEAIANFGLLGFIVSPLICRLFAFQIDKVSRFEKVFLVGSITLLMMYSPNYILVFVEFTVLIHIFKKFRLGVYYEKNCYFEYS